MRSKWKDPNNDRRSFVRRHPAHMAPVEKDNQPIILHVTLSLRHNRVVLTNREIHQAAVDCWRDATDWVVGYYMIMPEHIHLFCAPGGHLYPALRDWCGYWKRLLGNRLIYLKSVWLPDCWDTQMRNRTHYLRKLAYVARNPVRRGLVAESASWPYQGQIFGLPWIL